MMKKYLRAFAVLAVIGSTAGPMLHSIVPDVTAATARYNVVDLGTALGNPVALNDAGQILFTSGSGTANFHAYLWDNGLVNEVTPPTNASKLLTTGLYLNDNGQVSCWAYYASDIQNRACRWENGASVDLGTIEGDSQSTGINNAGQIMGQFYVESPALHPFNRAFLWTPGGMNGPRYNPQMQDVGTLGGANSTAMALNNFGIVVGYSLLADNTTSHAFYWDGSMHDLGTLGGVGGSVAHSINDSDEIVGAATTSQGAGHAVLWRINSSPLDLDTLGGRSSVALKINNNHQAFGDWFPTGTSTDRAFFWDAVSGMVDMGVLSGGNIFPEDMNDYGQVVGRATVGQNSVHGFLWSDGALSDLNDLISTDSGWIINGATAINKSGEILGSGTRNGVEHAILLKPITETPTVTSISPSKGLSVGGTTVTITGSGFIGASAVAFGVNSTTSFTVDSDTQITVLSPSHGAGVVDVSVSSLGGTSMVTQADQYLYTVPVQFQLPFRGDAWHYNTSPHDGEWAIDFQPPNVSGCSPEIDTTHSVYPLAAGTVIRATRSSTITTDAVSLYIEHDNGYVSYYTHLADTLQNTGIVINWNAGSVDSTDIRDAVTHQLHPRISADTPIGHPSCLAEPGYTASGVHVHIALTDAYPSWSSIITQTALCGWQLSSTYPYPFVRGLATANPLYVGDPNESSTDFSQLQINGQYKVSGDPVSPNNCPAAGSPYRVLDELHFMQSGEQMSGTVYVDAVTGNQQHLQFIVGPFGSDVDLTLTRPDGRQVQVGDAGVQYTKSDHYVSLEVDNADAGQWTYRILANHLDAAGEFIRIIGEEGNGSSTSLPDTTPPTTSLAATTNGNDSYEPGTWSKSSVTMSLSAADNPAGSGLSVIYVGVDNAGCTLANLSSCSVDSSPITVSSEGHHTVTDFSIDNAGNVENANTASVWIDETPPSAPSASFSSPGITVDGSTWYRDSVTVNYGGSTDPDLADGTVGSGVAGYSPSQSFSTTGGFDYSGTATDIAGNASGPTTGTANVDATSPTVTITAPASDSYVLNQYVTADYSCDDLGSGVASCVGQVSNGASIDTESLGTKTFAVHATDNVGHTADETMTYTVTYGVCALFDQSQAVEAGSTIPVKLQLCDAAQENVSSSSVIVTAVDVDGGPVQTAGNANPNNVFRFDATLDGYILNLKTTGLTSGSHTLHFTVGGDPVTHSVAFFIK